jgi:hypothetical protein
MSYKKFRKGLFDSYKRKGPYPNFHDLLVRAKEAIKASFSSLSVKVMH